MRWLLLFALASACDSKSTTSTPRTPGSARPKPANLDSSPDDAGIAETTSEPTRARKTCVARDEKHCCRKDDTLARVRSCDHDVGVGVFRRSDGSCEYTHCFCLPGASRIATPSGSRAIAELAIGDLVWTVDASGARVAAPIVAHGSVSFHTTHPIVDVMLADGRGLRASPGHPLVDGTLVGRLRPGDTVDGSLVRAIEIRMELGATWDLLPASATGTYWADGVRLGSTLAPR